MEKKDYGDVDVQVTELLRTSQSWDGAEMPDYPSLYVKKQSFCYSIF